MDTSWPLVRKCRQVLGIYFYKRKIMEWRSKTLFPRLGTIIVSSIPPIPYWQALYKYNLDLPSLNSCRKSCAEYLSSNQSAMSTAESFGHKVGFSRATAPPTDNQDPAVKIEELMSKDVNSVDGLHCFDTILPFWLIL